MEIYRVWYQVTVINFEYSEMPTISPLSGPVKNETDTYGNCDRNLDRNVTEEIDIAETKEIDYINEGDRSVLNVPR